MSTGAPQEWEYCSLWAPKVLRENLIKAVDKIRSNFTTNLCFDVSYVDPSLELVDPLWITVSFRNNRYPFSSHKQARLIRYYSFIWSAYGCFARDLFICFRFVSFLVYDVFLSLPWTVHVLFLGFRFVSDSFLRFRFISWFRTRSIPFRSEPLFSYIITYV
jgi:hypothetical protein